MADSWPGAAPAMPSFVNSAAIYTRSVVLWACPHASFPTS
jgi:hypothetical protein